MKTDLIGKTEAELEKLVGKLRQDITKTGAETAAGRHKNVRLVKALRQELARTLTVLRAEELRKVGQSTEEKA